MASISTRFTERFGTTHALAQAGMAFAGARPELAIAVGRGGGIGAIGCGFTPPEELRALIRTIRAELPGTAFNVNFITGLGNEEQVKVVAQEQVPIASFHWGHPPAHQLALLKDAGCSVWEQVGTVEAGRAAVGDGVDIIVAQGWEAGGHNYGGMGTVALVPAMLDELGDRALVLASGGIADARGVAAALTLGADAVWVGTRLVAAAEANVHPEHHRRLIAASGEETVRSGIFGPEMPFFNPIRLLRNRVVNDYTDRLAEVPIVRDDLEIIGETMFLGQPHTKRKFDNFPPTPETSGDFEEMSWLAGQGVGLIHDIRPAAEIVAEMMEGAAEIFRTRAASVVP